MSSKTVLYLPSTPLNILVSIAHALAFKDQQQSVMLIIDQKNIVNHPYLKSLLAWDDSPFIYVDVMAGKSKGVDKLSQRRHNFLKLKGLLDKYPFQAVAAGSDRRVEFQYAMHLCHSRNTAAKIEGWYLDDGFYSYAGRPAKWYKDWVNAIVKKLTYGMWWQEPSTVGASDWVTHAWLFDPCKSVMQLKKKLTVKIEKDWFTAPQVNEFEKLLFKQYGLLENDLKKYRQADLCILIPHPSNLKKMPDYAVRLHSLLDEAIKSGKKPLVKYHPRTSVEDPLGLVEKYAVQLIPAEIAFEFVLMLFRNELVLVGDVGTALLTSKWLRPEIKGVAVLNESSEFESRMAALLKQHGVMVKSDISELKRVLDETS